MKICILRICAILSMFYLDLGAYAKQLEMRGEAPKTTKQKNKEELQSKRYWQEQARKKAEEEKRLKAEREAEESRRKAEQIALNKYLVLIRDMEPGILGNESELTVEKIFLLTKGDMSTGQEEMTQLMYSRETRLLEIAKQIDAEKYEYIREHTGKLEYSRTGSNRAFEDFSRVLVTRVDQTRSIEGLFLFSPAEVRKWHRNRHYAIQSLVKGELLSYYQHLKEQSSFRPFWRGATLGLGGIGDITTGQNMVKNILPRNYLYTDANMLFWSFLRIGPYVAGNLQNGALEKFGGTLEFVIGGPRAALLLGSRFGGARQHPIGSLRNAITPSAGFELALGLPVALFFKYEAEFLQTDIEKFELNHQYNIGIRFRHYNDYFFSRGNLTRRQVSGNVFSD